MGIFGDSSTVHDEIIEKATNEKATEENWSLFMDICDKLNMSDADAVKDFLTALRKRLNNRDPHVVLLALSLLDSVWCNCTRARREISSAAFINEIEYKCNSSQRQIGEKTRKLVKKWAEAECKADASLSLVATLYKNLLADGHSFEDGEPKRRPVSNDPNVVDDKEADDIAKAIALSLAESSNRGGGGGGGTSSLYPSATSTSNTNGSTSGGSGGGGGGRPNLRIVRALYDFEAAEDNELSFKTGDSIAVYDDSDPNWWRGVCGQSDGLFPASFVTSDLRAEVPVEENHTVVETVKEEPVRIDEEELQRCIQLLEDCDPTGQRPDPPELERLEARARLMAPLIDARVAAVDKQHDELASVDLAIRDVLAMYDAAVQQLYQQQPQQPMPPQAYGQMPPQQQLPPQAHQQVPQQQPQMSMANVGYQPQQQQIQGWPQPAAHGQPY